VIDDLRGVPLTQLSEKSQTQVFIKFVETMC